MEETITKEANLESDCQGKAGLRWMEQGGPRASEAGKNQQKISKVETPLYIGRHTCLWNCTFPNSSHQSWNNILKMKNIIIKL